MLDHSPTTWYVMERIGVPYDVATAALGSIVPVSTIETATDGWLVVDEVRHARPGAVQGFVGRLRAGRLPWQMVRIEIGIEPWSRRESVVALRPTSRPPRTSTDRYFERALSVLGAVRDELVSSTAVDAPQPDFEPLRKAS